MNSIAVSNLARHRLGIVATWWVGVFFAVPMILAARAGSRPTLRASELLPPIAWLLACMAASAVLFQSYRKTKANLTETQTSEENVRSNYAEAINSIAETCEIAHADDSESMYCRACCLPREMYTGWARTGMPPIARMRPIASCGSGRAREI